MAYLVIFLINQLCQHLGYSTVFTRCYLDDSLLIPTILYLSKITNTLILRRQFNVTFAEMCMLTFISSICFEVVFPVLSDRFTGDAVDAVFYFIGGILYLLVQSITAQVSAKKFIL